MSNDNINIINSKWRRVHGLRLFTRIYVTEFLVRLLLHIKVVFWYIIYDKNNIPNSDLESTFGKVGGLQRKVEFYAHLAKKSL